MTKPKSERRKVTAILGLQEQGLIIQKPPVLARFFIINLFIYKIIVWYPARVTLTISQRRHVHNHLDIHGMHKLMVLGASNLPIQCEWRINASKKLHVMRMMHICVMANFRAQVCCNSFKSSLISAIEGSTCRQEGWPSHRRVFKLRFWVYRSAVPVRSRFTCATLPVRRALTETHRGFPSVPLATYMEQILLSFRFAKRLHRPSSCCTILLQCASFADLYKPICVIWTDECSAKLFSEA